MIKGVEEVARIVEVSPGTMNSYSKGQLIATTTKLDKSDRDHVCGEYRGYIVGGLYHGIKFYAQDFDDLNEKTVEIARIQGLYEN